MENIKILMQSSMGIPAHLKKVFAGKESYCASLEVPPLSVDATRVVHWQDWDPRQLPRATRDCPKRFLGRKRMGDHYDGHFPECPLLDGLVSMVRVDEWSCDISDVEGLAASKANLAEFGSLDDVAIERCPNFIKEITLDALKKNLSWQEIRIIHQENTSDHFCCKLWDGRVLLHNHGGSHHFAAARYIAKRLGHRVPLKGTMVAYRLEKPVVDGLREGFDMFVVNGLGFCDFERALEMFRATYLWAELPRPYAKSLVYFFPKAENKSAKVAALFRKSGYLDFGAYLSGLVEKQAIAAKKVGEFGFSSL